MRCRPARSRARCLIPAAGLPASSPAGGRDHAAHRNGRAAHFDKVKERAQLAVVMAQSADDDGRAVRQRDKRRKRRGWPARAEVPDDAAKVAVRDGAELDVIAPGRAGDGGIVGIASSMRQSKAQRGSRMIRAS